ncbi:MAG: T9SS type A sorting domain-containing protein, partial [Candidatus Zixiibacteriota bacterium]
SHAVIGSRSAESELWAQDYARSGGGLIYLGSGAALGRSISSPKLLGKAFDATSVTSSIFGVDSTLLISHGGHNPLFATDTLFRYFQPLAASPGEKSQFPELVYQHSGFYTPDYFNSGPLPFKGIMFPRAENTEVLYTYVSGRNPVSQLHNGVVGMKYTPDTHIAYTLFISPFETEPAQAAEFFRVLFGDIQTDITDERPEALLPKTFALAQNYPNPFNPSTTINFSLPKKAQVSLAIYNILGRRVATLVDEEVPAGEHSVTWNASNFATGIYFYQLKSGETKISKKALLLK